MPSSEILYICIFAISSWTFLCLSCIDYLHRIEAIDLKIVKELLSPMAAITMVCIYFSLGAIIFGDGTSWFMPGVNLPSKILLGIIAGLILAMITAIYIWVLVLLAKGNAFMITAFSDGLASAHKKMATLKPESD